MALVKSDKATYDRPASSPHSSGEVYVESARVSAPSTLAAGDILVFCKLPAECIPEDLRVESDDLDGAAAIVIDFALMELGGADIIANSELIDGSTVAQGGGVDLMDNLPAARRAVVEKAVPRDRWLTGKVVTVAATPQAGSIKASLFFRAAEWGEK